MLKNNRLAVKTIIHSFYAVLLTLFFAGSLYAADTYTVTIPANTEVTMGNPNAVLPLTITNNSASKDIRQITFTVDTTKYSISSSTIPPAGWCVNTLNNQTVSFALVQGRGACSNGSSASQITPGASLLFNITVLPLAAAADVAGDTLVSAVVDSQAGFTLSGGLPTWTRRALDASLTATPSSTGTGGTITLTMQVTNRSTATQSGLNTNPAPPSFSSAIVTNTGGPYYGSTILNGGIDIAASAITVASTTEFSNTGTIRIENEDICYTGKTAATFTGGTRGCNGTTAASHPDSTSVYSKTAFSLASGASGTMIWTYSADISGAVYFTARAKNSGNTAASASVSSNTVVIDSFTSALSVTPSAVISGQNITVEMDVANNGSTSLVNIAPSALTGCGGGATETLVSGPSPSSISSLAAGSSGIFLWTYQITGAVGQAYCLSGNAAANGPVNTNSSTSNTGTISSYSVTLSPSKVTSGSTNKTLTWTIYNGGGCPIKEVDIVTPAAGGNWTCSSVTPPAGWNASCANTVQFLSSGTGSDIGAGGTQSFSITFSATETVTSDKAVPFPVTLIARGCGGSSSTIGSGLTVTAYSTSLTHSPAGPIDADGSSRYNLTAVLTAGGSFVAGKTITFASTNGTLDPVTAVTDINGQATVAVVSPYSTSNTSANLNATYLNASGTDTVSFTGWTKPNLVYWGGLTPAAVSCGAKTSFQVTVKNVSALPMSITTNSYFAFNDYSAGGCSTYKAFLDSASAGSIAPGAVKTLSFGSDTNAGAGGGVLVPSTFISGQYEPIANPAPPPPSGMFFTEIVPPNPGPGANDQYRSVTDRVTVSGSCNALKINVIEWRELR